LRTEREERRKKAVRGEEKKRKRKSGSDIPFSLKNLRLRDIVSRKEKNNFWREKKRHALPFQGHLFFPK